MERERRVVWAAAVLVVSAALLGGQAASAGEDPPSADAAAPYPGNTLVTVQSYEWFDRNNGRAFVVTPEGEVVWEYDPPNSRVFDGELLENGNVLLSVATAVPAADCPAEFRDTTRFSDHCVRNRVVELDREKNVVWEYDWYDAFIHWHEVHDADRLPSGRTAVIDMGNDRAFVVSRGGEITWEWHAAEHIGPGTDFWEEYVPEGQAEKYRRKGPESDWTHMNDIDRLDNGNFQLSIRNFDVVLEVDPGTNGIVDVVGAPGDYSVVREQHDPNRLERHGTLLVADSKNNRVVELDVATGRDVWTYDGTGAGGLQWPRDADRLPNGNTLVVDSRNFRVLEVGPDGEVVWEHSLRDERGIVYDADRVGLSEEPDDVPPGGELASRYRDAGPVGETLAWVESWAGFVLPAWMRLPELSTLFVGLLAALWLAAEGALTGYRRLRRADE